MHPVIVNVKFVLFVSYWNPQEDMYEEEVRLDARIHPRIIGAKGRGIARLMEKFEVELRFPRQDDPNSDPNVVTISGTEDNVLDCKEHLLNLEEEFVSSPFFPFKKSFFFCL